ncbi:MAG: Do family serine endopeptidase [Spirochaetaceae bacterium]|nr:Do family serine endopeptidase [Spirochaetaceae bacterium]MCF7949066.1 Do family serine endopeptidase [Spirochaetia bacterium]MCF7950422.1 Do family serine endopeptidase [Spirochaetaceae bacterium]
MNHRKLFYSKKFFLFNLVLVGILVGFTLSLVTFGCSTEVKPGEKAQAQTSTGTIENGSATSTALSLQNSFRSVAQKALPVVVELKVVEIRQQRVPDSRGWPWDFLFPEEENNNNNNGENQEREFRSQGLGSGVIVRNEGNKYYILTNDHVVGEADEIVAVLNDGREFTATLVGKDPRKDLALVMFEAEQGNIPIAELGDSDATQVGDWVLAVGSPFGFVSSVTAGIVSAKGRSGPQGNISDFIQTDAAINRGNSGGALVNIHGEVVGINTWIAAPTGGSVGLGFSIPINNAKKTIEDFITKGKVEYGWLGVTVGDVNQELAEELGIEETKGAFIHNVYIDSPADKGGIRPGDFITQINGVKVTSRDEVVRKVGDLEAGDTATFKVNRFGSTRTVEVKIGERKDSEEILSNQKKLWPGMIVVPLNEEVRKQLNLDDSQNGVLVANVDRGTKTYIGGIRNYDVVTAVNDEKIETIEDFYQLIGDKSIDEFKISYLREGEKYFTGIER